MINMWHGFLMIFFKSQSRFRMNSEMKRKMECILLRIVWGVGEVMVVVVVIVVTGFLGPLITCSGLTISVGVVVAFLLSTLTSKSVWSIKLKSFTELPPTPSIRSTTFDSAPKFVTICSIVFCILSIFRCCIEECRNSLLYCSFISFLTMVSPRNYHNKQQFPKSNRGNTKNLGSNLLVTNWCHLSDWYWAHSSPFKGVSIRIGKWLIVFLLWNQKYP